MVNDFFPLINGFSTFGEIRKANKEFSHMDSPSEIIVFTGACIFTIKVHLLKSKI